ncbi:MAG: antitoxin [Clostridioides sp.]|nr:antitoxin [Clostridioides sp.]
MQDNYEGKIESTLSDSLISEKENIVQSEKINRDDFAKEAFQFYISQKKKYCCKETIINGYMEMGNINLSLAELGMTTEELSPDVIVKEEKA